MNRLLSIIFASSLALLAASVLPAASDPTWGQWPQWGDQGDGTYRNPVLPVDYSDIDCIRVGSDYYAISSTFQFSPGMVILHSKDLVNWRTAGHAISDITQISPNMNWNRMDSYGRGVWAGAIRHHDGRFWVYFGTPDEGYFMTSAADVAGPWEPLHPILKEKGWDDCCPFWDDDGQGWFVGTNFNDGYKIHLWKLSADGRDILPKTDCVIHQSRGSEANKLYKINGTYYHFFSEVRKGGRAVMMRRAKNITGPYSEPKQLSHPQREVKEPNQGGLVQTEKGDWVFFTHHGSGSWEGRAASLLPVTWINDWPIIGEPDADSIGTMVWEGKKPVEGSPILFPQGSEEFTSASLAPQWEWNYQPRADKWSLTERPGFLRLYAFRGLDGNNLLKIGNILTQRSVRALESEVIVRIELDGMADNQRAGLCHFSAGRSREKPAANSASLGIVQAGSKRFIEFSRDGAFTRGPAITSQAIWLKSSWGLDGVSQFFYSEDGVTFAPFGKSYPLAWASYRGDRIGLFTFNNAADAGHIDVDWMHYEFKRPELNSSGAQAQHSEKTTIAQ
jgi:beta-xylosidase